jgi:AraC-like DNA-binding protein
MTHLKNRGVERRRSIRKLSDASVAQAAILYAKGLSLARVAMEFGVSEWTVTREFRSAGLLIRPR